MAVVSSPNGKWMATGSKDCTIILWEFLATFMSLLPLRATRALCLVLLLFYLCRLGLYLTVGIERGNF